MTGQGGTEMPEDAFAEAIKVYEESGAVEAIEFAYRAGLEAGRG